MFSKSKVMPQSGSVAVPMRAESKRGSASASPFSVLGDGVTVTGNISAAGDLHIEGRVEGDVSCATLVLGETGHVEGGISATEARIAGSVSGSISADQLTIEGTARTSGDISYACIDMQAGAQTDGRLSHRGNTSELKLVAEAKSEALV